ncbi:MAG: aspartate/glutamate racemase family protein, partial [Rhodoplanes sp.]
MTCNAMHASYAPTILVFDSGLGGLTVFREVVKARPDARYVYVADDAFFPYGRHEAAALIARLVPLMGKLIAEYRPDLVVIACNTASTLVLTHLRAAYSVPFVGTVPAIKPACASSKSRLVSVLGTEATVAREYTRKLIRDFGQGCEIALIGSARLASLAETALRAEPVEDAAILAEIAPCFIA